MHIFLNISILIFSFLFSPFPSTSTITSTSSSSFFWSFFGGVGQTGSNVFTNFIALGLPWLTAIALSDGQPYSVLEDAGIVVTIMMLNIVLVISYLLLFMTNWKLTKGIMWFCLITYFSFITALICLSFLPNLHLYRLS